MSKLFAVVVVGLAACGRIGFDPAGDGAAPVAPAWRVEPSGTTAALHTIASAGGDNMFVVGDDGVVLRRVDGAWTPLTSTTQRTLWSIWFDAADDGWAVGSAATALHWDGTAWSSVETGASLAHDFYDLMPISPSDVWIVGDAGTLEHFDGSTWTASAAGTTRALVGVWALGSDALWICGEAGMLFSWDGSTLAPMSSGTTQAFNAIMGPTADDVWAVGYSGTIVHYDGGTWSPSASGTTAMLSAVYAGSDGVWTAGDAGTLLHYDGSAWTAISGLTTEDINGLYAVSATDIYAVGANGLVLHYSP